MFYELTKLPVRRGGFVEFEYAAWATPSDKDRMTARGYQPSPTDLVLADEQARVLPCQVANNHRIQIQETGSRIITNGGGRMRLNDGSWVTPQELRDEATRMRAEMIGFARETFSVDTSAEIAAVIQGFMQRETMRQQTAWRDPKGKRPWQRDARGTTLNLQVGAGANDGYIYAPSTFNSSSSDLIAGDISGQLRAYAYFTGLPGSAITINSATCQWNYWYSANISAFYSHLLFEASASSTAPTSYSDFDGRTRTTARTAYDQTTPSAGFNSISVTSALQEVCNLGSPTTALLFHDDNYSSSAYIAWYSYNNDTTKAPKLDIDYTAGGGGGMSFGSGGLAFRSGRVFGGKALR